MIIPDLRGLGGPRRCSMDTVPNYAADLRAIFAQLGVHCA
jgi:hypothetical protein